MPIRLAGVPGHKQGLPFRAPPGGDGRRLRPRNAQDSGGKAAMSGTLPQGTRVPNDRAGHGFLRIRLGLSTPVAG